MNRFHILTLMGLMGLLAVPSSAQAEIIEVRSKIAEVNATAGYLKVYYLNHLTEQIDEIKVDVDSSTRFQGVAALRDLKKDDEVSIQANYEGFTHEWTAIEIAYAPPPPLAEKQAA